MDIDDLAARVMAGERRALARAITLVESSRTDHRTEASALIDAVSHSGRQALRIGLSGTPGVGKSTFIEAFGVFLVEHGLRVAVLAVDPSSARSGGSILGDKTRMERLARTDGTFIRPSPSRTQLGGVARRTREAVTLCEAAGFDVVLIETVGVGQSETMVAGMADLFLLLIAPAGGDELQGVKRGIMEMADLILVNKADGPLLETANRLDGLPEAWEAMTELAEWRKAHGVWDDTRAQQARAWFEDDLRHAVLARLEQDKEIRALVDSLGTEVAKGATSPAAAADQVLAALDV